MLRQNRKQFEQNVKKAMTGGAIDAVQFDKVR